MITTVLPRRGPGRPRKDWAASFRVSSPSITPPGVQGRIGRPLTPTTPIAFRDPTLDLSQAELLHHFTMYTAPTLVATRHPDHPVVKFWQCNAAQIGFSEPFVLHLALSLAACDLKRLKTTREGRWNSPYLSLASQHLSLGITNMAKALDVIDGTNRGALLVSSLLVCFCTLSAGPKSADDLLLCKVGNSTVSGGVLPFARGMRLIQESIDFSTFYTGLLRPLHPVIAGSVDDPRPTCYYLGLPRIDWVGPLNKIRDVIADDTSHHAAVYYRTFKLIVALYEGLYGKDDGTMEHPAHYKIVLAFLYFVEDQFVTCVKEEETVALLILAYYAPLLKADSSQWFLHGWAEHIVRSISKRIDAEHAYLLVWPSSVVE